MCQDWTLGRTSISLDEEILRSMSSVSCKGPYFHLLRLTQSCLFSWFLWLSFSGLGVKLPQYIIANNTWGWNKGLIILAKGNTHVKREWNHNVLSIRLKQLHKQFKARLLYFTTFPRIETRIFFFFSRKRFLWLQLLSAD